MQRMGMVIGIAADKIAQYRELHAAVWPQVLATLARANVRNYTIFLREPENLLFGYWEYTGTDYHAHMQILDGLAVTEAWLALTDPCQAKLASAGRDEWWSMMPEIFHLD